jgi:hypothetical protein
MLYVMSQEQEITMLENQAKMLENALKELKKVNESN